MNKKILFGSPIYSYHIDKQSYDKEKVLNHILENYNIDKERNNWDNDSNIHHSYGDWNNNKFNHSVEIYDEILTPLYSKIIKNFFDEKIKLKKEIKYKFDIANYTCVGDSQYMKSHRHLPDFVFTCVHYLQFDRNEHTGIRLFNTNDYGPFVKHLLPNFYDKINNEEEENSYMFEHYDYLPVEDEMIIFSGLLPHAIPRQMNTTKPRISIVTNIRIENE